LNGFFECPVYIHDSDCSQLNIAFQIDLDTIDVSNLNRQFLFQKKHVGKSKAKIACETALTFNPDVKV